MDLHLIPRDVTLALSSHERLSASGPDGRTPNIRVLHILQTVPRPIIQISKLMAIRGVDSDNGSFPPSREDTSAERCCFTYDADLGTP